MFILRSSQFNNSVLLPVTNQVKKIVWLNRTFFIRLVLVSLISTLKTFIIYLRWTIFQTQQEILQDVQAQSNHKSTDNFLKSLANVLKLWTGFEGGFTIILRYK